MPQNEAYASGQPHPEYLVFQADAGGAEVLFSQSCLDQLVREAVQGLGAIPKRGAEVGGILLGQRLPGPPPKLLVEGLHSVPCSHSAGPSYALTAAERREFHRILEEFRHAEGALAPVGFFRSLTRDPLALPPEDFPLLAEEFPEPDAIVLVVRPFTTRPSEAGLFLRVGGQFSAEPTITFPLRRPESPQGRQGRHSRQRNEASAVRGERFDASREGEDRSAAPGRPDPAPAERSYDEPLELELEPGRKRRLIWLPVSLLALLLGVFVGFQIGISSVPVIRSSAKPDYALGLVAEESGENLLLHWNRAAPAFGQARSGVLTIADGVSQKSVPLDSTQLMTGSVLYRRTSPKLRVELSVQVGENVRVVESLNFEGSAPAPSAPH